jgi:O-antigen/teichoic acid export membrane protein
MFIKFKNSNNVRAVLYLMGSNILSLPLILISNVILGRFLGASGFGDYTFLISLLTVFVTVFTFGFYQAGGRAVVLSSSRTRIKQFYGAELLITFFLALTMSVVMGLYFYFDGNIKQKNLDGYLWVLVIFSWTFFLRRGFNVLFQSSKNIELLSLSKVLQPAIFLIVTLLIYFYGFFDANLMTAVLALFLTHSVSVLFIIYKLNVSFKSVWKRVSEIWLYNKTFGIHLYIGGVLPLAFASLSGILISYNSDDNSGVGFYALAFSLASVITLIPNTIATVFYKEFSKQKQISLSLILVTILVTLVALVFLVALISPFIRFAYGEEFLTVIDLVLIMVAGLFAHGMGDFFNKFLGANGYGRMLRNGAIFTGIVLFFSSITLIPIFKEYGAAYSALLAGFSYFISMSYYYVKVVSK